jgi:hypothetical protein
MINKNTINYGNNSKLNQIVTANNQTNHVQSHQNNASNLDVVDVSEDETSITSMKGEVAASDLSDNEIQNKPHLKLSQRSRLKKPIIEQNPKRPTTPMDIRTQENQKAIAKSNDTGLRNSNMKFKNQQISNENIQQPTGRFNEWDPFNLSRQQQINPNERQKSPHNKSSKSLLQQQQQQQQLQQLQQQQQQQQQQSNFAHTFLNTDSSPRQSSGRSQLGSANNLNQKLPLTSQQQTNTGDMNSSSNLDLIISGQKLGGRKDLSPTNTPRDLTQIQQSQSSQQQQQQPISVHRPFTRRLQPLDKLNPNDSLIQGVQQNNEAQLFKQNEPQLLRPKK